MNKIRERFPINDSDVYSRFISLLRGYSTGEIDLTGIIKEVVSSERAHRQIKVLFYYQPDLIRDFIAFLPPDIRDQAKVLVEEPSIPMSYPPPFLPVSIPVQQYSTSPVVSAQPEPVIRLIEKSDKPSHVRLSDDDDATLRIIREEGGPHHYTVFLKVCMLFAKKIISLAEFVMLTNSLYPEKRSVIHAIHELLKSHSIPSQFVFPFLFLHRQITDSPAALLPEQIKQLPRCTPSYHQLPAEYLQRGGEFRSFGEGRILNDNWVSCPIGSEEFTSGVSEVMGCEL